MTTLRQAVQEYVRMRRDLGFKLHEAGKGLLAFVTFMEQHRASYITQALALAWAQQPANVQPASQNVFENIYSLLASRRDLQRSNP